MERRSLSKATHTGRFLEFRFCRLVKRVGGFVRRRRNIGL